MIFSRELFFYLSKNYSFIYTGLFENVKARILKSIITWSEMGQQTVQAKEVYKNTATQFLHYLNNCHANIKFTVEFEENNTIPFLDILIKRCNHTFSTSIYRKKTFTGLYTKWDSFTPRKYKVNLIRTLTFRCFRICSSPSLLRSCLDKTEETVVTKWLSCWCYPGVSNRWKSMIGKPIDQSISINKIS